LYRLSADQGNAEAQACLGYMYDHGRGVPRDHPEACRLYRLSAEQGHMLGQFCLGLMYVAGRGVPQDYVLAYMWSSLSAAAGYEQAVRSCKWIVKLLTPSQVAEARRLALAWKPVERRLISLGN